MEPNTAGTKGTKHCLRTTIPTHQTAFRFYTIAIPHFEPAKHSLDEHSYKRTAELPGNEERYSRLEYQQSTPQCGSTTHPPGSEMGDSSL